MNGRLLATLILFALAGLLIFSAALTPHWLLLAVLYAIVAALFLHVWFKFKTARYRVAIVAALAFVALFLASFTNWNDPTSPAFYLIQFAIVLLAFLVVAISLSKRSMAFALIAASGSALFACVIVSPSFFNARSRVTDIDCQKYSIVIRVNKNGELNGQYDAQIAFQWENDGDIEMESNGKIAKWQDQKAVMEEIQSEGFDDWTIQKIDISPADIQNQFDVSAHLRKSGIDEYRERTGWMRQVVKVYNSDYISRANAVEILLEVPQDFSLSHNLDGSFSESVLDDGEIGQRLLSDNILSYDSDTILLSFISPSLQSPFLNWLANFSASSIFLCIWSAILGALLFLSAVFTDVYKDETLKPYAKRILARLGLVKPDAADGSDIPPDSSAE